MKKKIFILTGEERLAEAISSNFDPNGFDWVVATDWATGSDQLFAGQFDMLFLDLEALRGHNIDTFVSIDSMCSRENVHAALVVRVLNTAISALIQKLSGMQTIIETKRGRTEFNQAVRRAISDLAQTPEQQSEAQFADATVDSVIQTEVDLPLPASGPVNEFSVFSLLFAANVRNASGFLQFKQGPEVRRFGLRSGDLALSDGCLGSVDLRDTFKWTSGSFTFEEQDQVTGRKKRLSSLIADTARNDIPRRMAMDAVMETMSYFPVQTTLAEQARFAYKAFPEALQQLEKIDGSTPWTDLMDDDELGFQIAYFLTGTHLVQSFPERGLKKVSVVWAREVREARDRQQQAKVLESKAYRAVSKQEEMERELRNLLRDFRAATPYEVYSLWEGCGSHAVQNRFYEMVKEHHPDVYGGNTTGRVKTLAQDIFILVKDTFVVLKDLESGEQTVEMPTGFDRPETQRVKALEEVSEAEPLTGEFELEVEFDTKRSRTITRPKTRSDVDVKKKMSQLSSVRKKRARRKSVAGSKRKKSSGERIMTPDPHTLDILSDVVSESSVETIDEVSARNRMEKLQALRERTRDKNPNVVSVAQEHFRDGFTALREEDFPLAFTKFEQAFRIEPDRANHKAFYAYIWFKTDPSKATEAEDLLREAIEMNDRQTQPDALLFLAHMLKARGEPDKALKFYERAYTLNPNSREAERELRLAKMRKGSRASEPGTFIKNLFKK